jgi:hypothetical protein
MAAYLHQFTASRERFGKLLLALLDLRVAGLEHLLHLAELIPSRAARAIYHRISLGTVLLHGGPLGKVGLQPTKGARHVGKKPLLGGYINTALKTNPSFGRHIGITPYEISANTDTIYKFSTLTQLRAYQSSEDTDIHAKAIYGTYFIIFKG